MTSYVENETEVSFSFDVKEVADSVIETILEQEGCPYEVQINLLLTDNEGIRTYNAQFREIDRATDVLSFPNVDYEEPADFSDLEEQEADYFDPDSGELILGDIIISVDKVKEQAESYGHSEKREFAFLVAHSMLHLCGYDHMEEEEAKVMEAKQEEALKRLGITREAE
ncbi:MAG: rRNA maturation RNase YbeY [Lachnospiraceae bacterium]|nr:rRNA maturation RNase YbeY [Lachnospiraceae bacterium]